MVKNLPSVQETWVRSLGWEDSLEDGVATHSSIVAWRTSMDRGAFWAIQSMGSQRVGHNRVTKHIRNHKLEHCDVSHMSILAKVIHRFNKVPVKTPSLSGFGIRVMVASQNEFGSLPSSEIFWKSLSRIDVSTGESNGSPLQCSCLESPRDGGAWWAAVYGVAQSQTRLK